MLIAAESTQNERYSKREEHTSSAKEAMTAIPMSARWHSVSERGAEYRQNDKSMHGAQGLHTAPCDAESDAVRKVPRTLAAGRRHAIGHGPVYGAQWPGVAHAPWSTEQWTLN